MREHGVDEMWKCLLQTLTRCYEVGAAASSSTEIIRRTTIVHRRRKESVNPALLNGDLDFYSVEGWLNCIWMMMPLRFEVPILSCVEVLKTWFCAAGARGLNTLKTRESWRSAAIYILPIKTPVTRSAQNVLHEQPQKKSSWCCQNLVERNNEEAHPKSKFYSALQQSDMVTLHS